MEHDYDVLVVGAGNAGLCSALSASETTGLRVGVVEKAPKEERGGNSALTGHMRFVCESREDLLALTPYAEGSSEWQRVAETFKARTRADLWDETMRVTDGRADPALLEVLTRESYPTMAWLHRLGHDWVLSQGSTTDNALMLSGGGRALQTKSFELAEARGIAFHYRTGAESLLRDGTGAVVGVRALGPDGLTEIRARSVVLAAGGFEASPEMRARYLGRGWDSIPIRGVPYNTGDGLRAALDAGAASAGSWSTCHASPQDANRPAYGLPSSAMGGGTEWDRYLYPFGVMVDRDGVRFTDEGADVRSRTYARMGREILGCPGGVAWQILDAKVRRAGLVDDRYDRGSGATANTLDELAGKLGISSQLAKTVDDYNAAVVDVNAAVGNGKILDGIATAGLWPPKSNFALRLDEPPFEGYAVTCGMTFTFGGLHVDPETAQVDHVSGAALPGLFTAGEMLGGLWHGNYAGGSGMSAGAIFGRIAGRSAARAASA